MIYKSLSASSDFSKILWMSSPPICPCEKPISFSGRKDFRRRNRGVILGCMVPFDGRNQSVSIDIANSVKRGLKTYSENRIRNEFDEDSDSIQLGYSNEFSGFREDPVIGKLTTQLGVIHPIPLPPINKNIGGMFVLFFISGVVFDKLWTSRKQKNKNDEGKLGIWPQVPTSFSLFLEKDLQRKESVEWVNMVLGKLWKVYRGGLENWVIGLIQPVIDDLKKPDYVERVEIKQFSLGDEPFVVRNVERRTSRSNDDLQYQIGLRYTGGAQMLLMLTLKFGIIPIKVPVGIRDFDIDGELWVKLRLIPTEPWVGAASWAFVSLPKIKFELLPFRLFNLMAIPVLSMFLKKLLTEDLPRLFVRPNKIVLDFQKGKTVGPVQNDFKSGEMQEGNKDFAGELSVTLVDARKLSYIFYGKTDPYVELRLEDQVIHSKKNSQTTIIGPPGQPIWNQDFSMLVTDPRNQKLSVQVKDSFGFIHLTVGAGEVDLRSLKDTVPTDRVVTLQGGLGPFNKGPTGEILLRLTYKAYVEDEEDERIKADVDASDDEFSELASAGTTYEPSSDKESFMDVLAAFIVSEEFQGIVASETLNNVNSNNTKSTKTYSGQTSDFATADSGSDSGGSALLWLGVITTISILTAINMGGSNIFNP
ncbi:putative C2 domain, synaptotagmin-like mitochondrial-lipid-binding domain, C2 domain superfamily [Helianthus annuus]|uniref:C2 domain, synaptotagmin-like mitochondrial-lipid-binding domain, C2 domain superfamily n=1 Tax=Helianthus annuus TaxID=4232 RepID=A0A251SSS7_HELAN|nr:extended synaptotagmin-1 [Helianthus annuus]KAF5772233.1 putative C2 domain, synaptotagmin-like mitochondrial-lipid-binding domain, C2 domain superfamily [Helianthus annuus]